MVSTRKRLSDSMTRSSPNCAGEAFDQFASRITSDTSNHAFVVCIGKGSIEINLDHPLLRRFPNPIRVQPSPSDDPGLLVVAERQKDSVLSIYAKAEQRSAQTQVRLSADPSSDLYDREAMHLCAVFCEV